MNFTLYRRHAQSCPGAKAAEPAKYTKCKCALWAYGTDETTGGKVQRSLQTRDWQRGTRKLALIENPSLALSLCLQPGCGAKVRGGRCEKHTREILSAVQSYHEAHPNISAETHRYRERNLRLLQEFLERYSLKTVDEITLDHLQAFRASRKIAPRTWVRDLEQLRHFFRFCLDSEWIARNWAAKVPMPRNLKPADREPYELKEITRIVAATELIGRASYERLRARAMVLLLRRTALRIKDVALMRKNRIRNGEIFIRTAKNGKPVRLPLPADLKAALAVLPLPRGADPDCPYLFWSGKGSERNQIETVRRTLDAVYKKSGVQGAINHRFRHTIATEILELGGTFEDAADFLGDSEAIIRKHYAKWSAGRQARLNAVCEQLWKAEVLENQPENRYKLDTDDSEKLVTQ